MPLGVVFALCAYLLYSCCDAIIKGFGSDLSIQQIAFFSALFSLVPAILTKPKNEQWRRLFKLRHPLLVHLRAATGLVGNLCVIYAFVHIPLAEVYSLAFLAPIFIVILSVWLLRESVGIQRWFFLFASFLGVLLVVRPGFRELQPGHLTAVLAAMMGAITTTALRRVAPVEQRVSLIGIPLGYILVVNGIWMLPGFVMPSLQELALLIAIGALGGSGNVLFVMATRTAPASQIAPGQYSQIAWAIFFGAVFFREYPDPVSYAGLLIVVTAGVLNVMSDETRIRVFSRLMPLPGPATTISEISQPLEGDEPAKGEEH